MLDEMHIANVALIRDTLFRPSPAMTVITGETGSGKTALLNALKLLVGERAQASMVREGADELCVEGRFFLNEILVAPGGSEVLEDVEVTDANGVSNVSAMVEANEGVVSAAVDDRASEDGVVVCRRVGVNGRSRVSIDGSLGTVKDLSQTIGESIDLCGQHEHQQLLNTSYQRKLFDRWGGDDISIALERYQAAFSVREAAQAEVDRLRELSEADSVAFDRARFVLDQIETVAPERGEYETLLEELPFYENAELLIGEARSVYRTITGEGGVNEQLESIMASLNRIQEIDTSLDAQRKALDEALITIDELSHEFARYQSSIDFSETELEIRQTRLSALQGIMRGYGPTMEEVFANLERAKEIITSYETCDEALDAACGELDEAERELVDAAEALAAARAKIAPRFEEAVTDQMARLEMGSAVLQISLKDLPREQWNRSGSQVLEYLFVPGAGLSAQKLSAIASGGEISRVMLAIKVVLGACDDVDTLVFDEIDAGVGGKTALALASVLKDLAKTHQVIVVTHLAQVAVLGDVHYLVEKHEDEQVTTEIKELSAGERISEVARMLAGKVDETALVHARELFSSAVR